MTQDKDQMRAEFEAWYFEGMFADAEGRKREGQSYKYAAAAHAWTIWQAARASAPQGVPEGLNKEILWNMEV